MNWWGLDNLISHSTCLGHMKATALNCSLMHCSMVSCTKYAQVMRRRATQSVPHFMTLIQVSMKLAPSSTAPAKESKNSRQLGR